VELLEAGKISFDEAAANIDNKTLLKRFASPDSKKLVEQQ
jgi:hypothetical protein